MNHHGEGVQHCEEAVVSERVRVCAWVCGGVHHCEEGVDHHEEGVNHYELLGAPEVGVVGGEHLEQEPLVRLRQLPLEELGAVQQVHPHLLHLELEAGDLVLHLPVDGLVGLHERRG